MKQASHESLPIVVSLKEQIYQAVNDGLVSTLDQLLSQLTVDKIYEYLCELMDYYGMKCTLLMIAILNGHNDVVEILLDKFKPDVEIEGVIIVENETVKGATALWCSVCVGNFNIVQRLIVYGAQINHCTASNSTPLRVACYRGLLDIVQYLVEHNADINIAKMSGHTCLMIASFNGHLDVVKYLLQVGCDVNRTWQNGITALHDAVENGHLSIVKTLLEYGAIMIKIKDLVRTPFMIAIKENKSDIANYFLNNNWLTQIDAINELELLGSLYLFDNGENQSIEKAYYCMEWAMKLRYKNPNEPLYKQILPPLMEYDYRLECQTLQELELIRSDFNALRFESLLILERILGINHRDVLQFIRDQGTTYADNNKFDKCLKLWLRVYTYRSSDCIADRKSDLRSFSELFCRMIEKDMDISSDILIQVLKMTINEIQKNIMAIKICEDESLKETLEDNRDDNIYTVLCLCTIVTKADIWTNINNSQIDKICKFPCEKTVNLLIECQANVNALDNERNTPLHIIVRYPEVNNDKDFLNLQTIIRALINANAHIDSVNSHGDTPEMWALTKTAEILIKTQAKLSLKCATATLIKKLNLDYRKIISTTLYDFIERHGIPIKNL
ncbi:unnamed protein product [Didymodactylos carnosus]|uniref:Protein fem-1 homolog B n=1 Tax=Didymodactylos carnosus TaxID=1234261 RepID=A0A815DFI6_9BILA|nr:unnamed protein product [Didymodactylos carnosus]CAF4109834.1 unnamed protein product [Didymodactylos carnosus]